MVKRSPHATVATESGVCRGLPKTCVLSGCAAQSTYPISSAQAVDAKRNEPASRMNERVRDIAPSSARGHAEP